MPGPASAGNVQVIPARTALIVVVLILVGCGSPSPGGYHTVKTTFFWVGEPPAPDNHFIRPLGGTFLGTTAAGRKGQRSTGSVARRTVLGTTASGRKGQGGTGKRGRPLGGRS